MVNSEFVQIRTNFYPMKIKKDFKTIFQYSIEFEPEIPSDASKLLEKIIDPLKKELKTKLGFICYKGRMLWGSLKLDLAHNVNTTVDVKGDKQTYEVLIKPADKATLTIEDFIAKDPNNLTKLTQILNINTKNSLKNIGYRELDRGRYYNSEDFEADKIKEAGLSVWRGYEVTVNTVNANLFLKVDVCSRVLRLESLLDTMKNTKKIKDKAYINETFKDISVITRYGNHRIHKVVEIDYSMTPKSTFITYKSQ